MNARDRDGATALVKPSLAGHVAVARSLPLADAAVNEIVRLDET